MRFYMKSTLETTLSNIVKYAGDRVAKQFGHDDTIKYTDARDRVQNALRDQIANELQPELNKNIPADMRALFSISYNTSKNKFEIVETQALKEMREYKSKPIKQLMEDLEKITKDTNQSQALRSSASQDLQRLRQVDANITKYSSHISGIEKLLQGKIDGLNEAISKDSGTMADRILDQGKRQEAHKKNVPLIVLAAVGVVAAIGLLVGSIYLIKLGVTLDKTAVRRAVNYIDRFGRQRTQYVQDGGGILAILGGVYGIAGSMITIPFSIVGLVESIMYRDDRPVKLDNLQAELKVASAMNTAINEMSDSIKDIMSNDPSTAKVVKNIQEISVEIKKETVILHDTTQVTFSKSIRDETIVAATSTQQEKRELDKAVRESTKNVKEISQGLKEHLGKFMEAQQLGEFLAKMQEVAQKQPSQGASREI